MKVFLSWSGTKSHAVAKALHEWLPCVIGACEPYVSSLDIEKGARWSPELARQLESSSFGILCVTSDSAESPWLNFEAGALSKVVSESRVCPVLLGMKKSDLVGPLVQFQLTVFESSDFRRLMASINATCGNDAVPERRLDLVFQQMWPALLKQLEGISSEPGTVEALPPGPLDEAVELLRLQHRVLTAPETLLPPTYLAPLIRRAVEGLNVNIGVPRDYPAWRELRLALEAGESALRRMRTDSSTTVGQATALYERLAEPARVLLHKLGERV